MHYVFGTADGALFVLHAAISNPLIHKIVAYEPLFLFGQPGAEEFKTLLEHYQKYAAEGDIYSAMESLTKESKTYLFVNIIPEFIMIPVWKLLLGFDA